VLLLRVITHVPEIGTQNEKIRGYNLFLAIMAHKVNSKYLLKKSINLKKKKNTHTHMKFYFILFYFGPSWCDNGQKGIQSIRIATPPPQSPNFRYQNIYIY